MRAAQIEVRISKLVVDGAQMQTPEQLGPALQQELARLLEGGPAESTPSTAAPSVEAQIAHAIYERIGDRMSGAQEGAPGVKANKESR